MDQVWDLLWEQLASYLEGALMWMMIGSIQDFFNEHHRKKTWKLILKESASWAIQGSYRPGKVLEFDLGPGKLLEFEKMPFVLELSWNFVKSSLKI